MNDMVKEKSWKDFRETGLLCYINHILHVFGWAICIEVDNNEAISAYPARVKFRGFGEESQSKSYIKISEWMKNNADNLLAEAKDEDSEEFDKNIIEGINLQTLPKEEKENIDSGNEWESILRDKIATAVENKMDYMATCPNERKTIIGIIRGTKIPVESLCNTCFHEDCPIKNDYKEFCKWVASEVIDEEDWELNWNAFAEIACRKLNKLHIVDEEIGTWVFKADKPDSVTNRKMIYTRHMKHDVTDKSDYWYVEKHLNKLGTIENCSYTCRRCGALYNIPMHFCGHCGKRNRLEGEDE